MDQLLKLGDCEISLIEYPNFHIQINLKISDYSHSISGNGSVRSRRDTADSGRSSSLASGGEQQRQNINKITAHQNGDEGGNNGMGEGGHHEQPQLEMLITPRNLERSEFVDGHQQQPQENHQNSTNEVAEANLINFG